jgi:hypothetical protein
MHASRGYGACKPMRMPTAPGASECRVRVVLPWTGRHHAAVSNAWQRETGICMHTTAPSHKFMLTPVDAAVAATEAVTQAEAVAVAVAEAVVVLRLWL